MQPLPRRESLTEMTVVRLRDAIVTGEFSFGELLSEGRIAAMLGVSKTPVREAFQQLQREGLVEIQPQRGTVVFTPSEDEFEALVDFRTMLEVEALKGAMARSREALAQALVGVVARMRSARERNRIQEYLMLDGLFHETIVAHSGNDYLIDAYAGIASKMAALRTQLGREPELMDKSMREHEAISKAVTAGDMQAVLSVLGEHITRRRGSYWQERPNADAVAKTV